MSLLCKDSGDLNLFYRISYDTWNSDEAFYLRAAFHSLDEALSKFKYEFPSIEGKLIIYIVSI